MIEIALLFLAVVGLFVGAVIAEAWYENNDVGWDNDDRVDR